MSISLSVSSELERAEAVIVNHDPAFLAIVDAVAAQRRVSAFAYMNAGGSVAEDVVVLDRAETVIVD